MTNGSDSPTFYVLQVLKSVAVTNCRAVSLLFVTALQSLVVEKLVVLLSGLHISAVSRCDSRSLTLR